MGRLDDLRAEIDADPNTRGYAGMTDAQVATDLTTLYSPTPITRSATSITPLMLAASIKIQTAGEWPSVNGALVGDALAIDIAEKQAERDYIMWIGSMLPLPTDATWVQNGLTGGANGIWTTGPTFDAIEALYSEEITRAEELFLGRVHEGTVAQARAL